MLAALCQQPSGWQPGYALARPTGLKSGTLDAILIRLADRGLVEACGQEEPEPGRPGTSPRRGRRVAAPAAP
jgi:PadR family transcriptional regulator, regulatory protein PadR